MERDNRLEERRRNNGTIRVNVNALERLLKKAGTIALAGTAALTIVGGTIGYQFGYHQGVKEVPGYIPSGYVLTETQDQIRVGGSVTDTAADYYYSAYTSMYDSLDEYAKVIEDKNGLRHNQTVYPGDTITLPVMVDEANPHYIQTLVLQNQISDIEKNNYWVQYTVQFGDTISSLAAKASGSQGETAILTQKILEKNSSGRILQAGDTIWIVNPELGPLKISLEEEKEALQEELKSIAEAQKAEEKKPLSN